MRKPYIYVMPEAFILDTSVPVRWRILGILNGFFVNGEKCWASNEWIGEKINAHKDSVSQGVKELEEMGLIRAERTRRSRTIVPVLKTEIGGQTYEEGVSSPISDRPEDLSNSVSNSVSNTSEVPLRVEIEKEERPVRPERRAKDKQAVFDLFSEKKEPWWFHKQQKEAALRLFDLKGLEQVSKALSIVRKNRTDPFCPKPGTPFELEQKWEAILNYKNRV